MTTSSSAKNRFRPAAYAGTEGGSDRRLSHGGAEALVEKFKPRGRNGSRPKSAMIPVETSGPKVVALVKARESPGNKSVSEMVPFFPKETCLMCPEKFQFPYARHDVEGRVHAGTCCNACEQAWNKARPSLIDYVIPATSSKLEEKP